MSFKEFALHMYPMWILGISIMCAVMSTKYRDLLRIEKKAVIHWVKFLLVVTSFRFLLFKLFPDLFIFDSIKSASNVIPTGVVLTVFWEDAVHGLPLLILRKLIGIGKYTKYLHKFLMIMSMIEFASGHVYQGLFAAALLSFYVPISIKLGDKYGFGTVMIGHVIYDFCTVVFAKYLM